MYYHNDKTFFPQVAEREKKLIWIFSFTGANWIFGNCLASLIFPFALGVAKNFHNLVGLYHLEGALHCLFPGLTGAS